MASVSKPKGSPAKESAAESCLLKAIGASNPGRRAKYATKGLSEPELAPDTQMLLLRQLYMSHLERRRFADSLAIAEQTLELARLPGADPEGVQRELAHQDVARACSALGDFDAALGHLRLASRVAPARRRSFQLWCLGSTLYAIGCYSEAEQVLERSVLWATQHKVIHQALHALALAAQSKPADLATAYSGLSDAEVQPGIMDWIGGELLLRLGRPALALPLLRSFVERNQAPARAAGLRAEIQRAKLLIDGFGSFAGDSEETKSQESR